jgi:XXXCH domain-containing protein
VVLVPAGVMKVEIEAEEKKGKRKFSLELSWLEIMPEQEVTEAVTISSQAPEPVEEAGEGSEGEVGKEVPTGDKAYKRLKKEMKKTWETIVEAVERGQMPELPLVEEFYNQSKEMTTFPGKGDEYYQQYSAAADDLFAAAELEDMTNFSECVKTMEQLKKDCHDRYK